MAVKTITVTTDAYEALKELKGEHESFSETILRVVRRRPSLAEFAGILSEASGERLERAINENRKNHRISYEKRIKRIATALEGNDDRP